MLKLQSKFVLVGILSWVIVALVAVITVPAAPASADNPFPGPNRGPSNRNTTGVHGTLSAVSGSSISISPANGGNPVTLAIDSHTDVGLNGEVALATGQTVTAVYNSQTMVAERVLVNFTVPSPNPNKPAHADVKGTIAAVSGSSISITPANGGNPVTLAIDSHTDVGLDGEVALAIGQTVTAVYNSQTMVAERVLVNFPVPSPKPNKPAHADVKGTIAAVSGSSISITPANGGNPVTLTIDPHTDVGLNGEVALAAGQTVTAVYNSQTMVAERVLVNYTLPSSSENRTGNQNINDHDRNNNNQHGWFTDHVGQGFGWMDRLFHLW